VFSVRMVCVLRSLRLYIHICIYRRIIHTRIYVCVVLITFTYNVSEIRYCSLNVSITAGTDSSRQQRRDDRQ